MIVKQYRTKSPAESGKLLPDDPKERKMYPVQTGVYDYFPSAIIETSFVSYVGNDQHNPGESLHWARGKSQDEPDACARHIMEGVVRRADGKLHLVKDIDGTYLLAKATWRLMAMFQKLLEQEGAPLARGARLPEAVTAQSQDPGR